MGSLTPVTYELEMTEPKSAVSTLLKWSEGRDVELRGLEVVPRISSRSSFQPSNPVRQTT